MSEDLILDVSVCKYHENEVTLMIVTNSINPRKDNTMQTTKSTPNTNFDLKEAFALWEKKKGDKVYYTGKTAGDEPINIVAFVNVDKKSEKQPDINIYESGDKKPELVTLWKNTSKAGKTYYSGYTNDKERIIAFINGETQDGKYPSIRAYYKEDAK